MSINYATCGPVTLFMGLNKTCGPQEGPGIKKPECQSWLYKCEF